MKQINIPTERLMQGCQNNDRRCQEILYNRFAGKFLAICHRYAATTAEAEDLMQDGFILIFRNIGKYAGMGSFEGWMRRILVNNCISRYRDRQRMPQTTELDTTYHQPIAAHGNHHDAAHLLQMVNALPENYRIPFTLYAIDGYSHLEIGAMLGISEMQSRTNTCRARAALRSKLNGQQTLKTA